VALFPIVPFSLGILNINIYIHTYILNIYTYIQFEYIYIQTYILNIYIHIHVRTYRGGYR